jgi:membrane-bound ClpP family serine protease
MWALIITLVLIGLVLMGLEVLVIPGFGIAGILGIGSFAVSSYLTFSNFGVVAGMLLMTVVIIAIILFVVFVLRSKTWKKITLQTNIDSRIDQAPQNKGIEVGTIGIALTRLAPAGQAQLGDVVVEVFSRDSIVAAGSMVEVVEVCDNKIFVKVLI